jgi:hypothetical protein
VTSRSAIRAAIDTLDGGPTSWVAGVVDGGIADLLAAHDADALAPWDDMRPFVEAHLSDILRGLANDDDPSQTVQLLEPAFADIFARDVPVRRVLDTVATFHNRLLATLVEHALAQGGDASVAATIVRAVTGITNQWTQAYAERYLAESRRRIDSHQARARAAIEALVAGEPVGADVSQVLGVAVAGWHLACVITAVPGQAVQHRAVEAAAASFARATRTEANLRYETSTGWIWLWASGSRAPRVPSADDIVVSDSLVVGVGRPYAGAEGLRRSHLEAMDALRVVRAAGAPGSAGIDDVALAAMLSVDAERAGWFVERELAGLVGDDEQSRDLRDTLRAFYAARMRVAPAAEQLYVHRNTLINRLDRVEALLGHSVAERTAEVQAALLLYDVLTRSVPD